MGSPECLRSMNNKAYPSEVWYVCKYCKRAYQDSDRLWEHKKENHMEAILKDRKKKMLDTTTVNVTSPKKKTVKKPAARKKSKKERFLQSTEQVLKQDENNLCNTASVMSSSLIKGLNYIDKISVEVPEKWNSLEAVTTNMEISEDQVKQSPAPRVSNSEEGVFSHEIINIDTSMYDMDEDLDQVFYPTENVFLCNLNQDSQIDDVLLEISDCSTDLDYSASLSGSIIMEDGAQDFFLDSYNFEPYERFDYRQAHVKPDCYGSWRCPNCDEECINQFQLEFHQSKCTLYRCNLCIRTFTRRRYLDNHLSLVHNDDKNPCPVKPSPFHDSESDSSMTDGDTESDSAFSTSKPSCFNCRKCNINFSTRNELAAHIPTHRPNVKLECEICHQFFGSRKWLMLHSKKHSYAVSSSTIFKCHRCPAVFKNRSLLACHRQFHRRSFTTPQVKIPSVEFQSENAKGSSEFNPKLALSPLQVYEKDYPLIQNRGTVELSNSRVCLNSLGISAAVWKKFSYILNRKGPSVVLRRVYENQKSIKSVTSSTGNNLLASAAINMLPETQIQETPNGRQSPAKIISLVKLSCKTQECRQWILDDPHEWRNEMNVRYKKRYKSNRRKQIFVQKLRDFYSRSSGKNHTTVPMQMDIQETSISHDSSVEEFCELPTSLNPKATSSTTNSVISSSESVVSSISSSVSSSDSSLNDLVRSSPFPIVLLKRLSPSLLKKYSHYANSQQKGKTVVSDHVAQPNSTVPDQFEVPPGLLPAFSCWLCHQVFGQLKDIEHHLRLSHGVYSIVVRKLPKFNGQHDFIATIHDYLIVNHGVSPKQVSSLTKSALYACIECEQDLNFIGFKLHLYSEHKQGRINKSDDTTTDNFISSTSIPSPSPLNFHCSEFHSSSTQAYQTPDYNPPLSAAVGQAANQAYPHNHCIRIRKHMHR